MSEEQLNDFDADFDWLDKALFENYIKYYDYSEFINREEISSWTSGNVFRANWRDSDAVMAVKCSYDSTIKEIVHEVTCGYICVFFFLFFHH